MSDGTHHEENRSAKSDDEAALSARLARLGDRLDHNKASESAKVERSARSAPDASGLARAMRLSAELVGGVVVGAGIGLFIDYLAGTSPWGFILLVLLGFAGGVLTVMRSAGVIPERKL
jgi:ATP synthase protein I